MRAHHRSASGSQDSNHLRRVVHPDRRPQIQELLRVRFARLLGPRLQGISTGGAKTPATTWAWMKEVWGHTGRVNEGYGSTEVGGCV